MSKPAEKTADKPAEKAAAEKVAPAGTTAKVATPSTTKTNEGAVSEVVPGPEKKAAAEKTSGGAPAFTKGPRSVPHDAVITMGRDKEGREYGPEHNPKRPGSATHGRFAEYRSGMTIQQALDRGITSADLDYDVKKGFVTVSGGTAKVDPKVAKEQAPEVTKAAEEKQAA